MNSNAKDVCGRPPCPGRSFETNQGIDHELHTDRSTDASKHRLRSTERLESLTGRSNARCLDELDAFSTTINKPWIHSDNFVLQ